MMSKNDPCDCLENDRVFSHKFLLEDPYPITNIGQSLCDVTGYTKEEIETKFNNSILDLIYPEDKKMYLKYLNQLAVKEQTLSLNYRIIKKDGSITYVSDISYSHKKNDDKIYGFTMIAPTRGSNSPYKFHIPSTAAPFGYLQCTCEKYPKVLYINDKLLSHLQVTTDNQDWQDFLHENIYFAVPFEDRDKFRDYLKQAYESTEPIKIVHKLIKSNGERSVMIGWLGTITNFAGEKEFSFIYTDVDADIKSANMIYNNSYFKALESAYNIIFEINTVRKTVECIFGKDTSRLGKLYDVRMTIDSAQAFWVNNYIVEEDRQRMNAYFTRVLTMDKEALQAHPVQTEFRVEWEDKHVYSFIGVAIVHDSSSILFCCRDTANVQFSSLQARTIKAYRKFHHFIDEYVIAKRNLLGAIVYELDEENHCTPIYCSKSILESFSIRNDIYVQYIDKGFYLDEFEAFCKGMGMEEVHELITGEKMVIYLNKDKKKYPVTFTRLFDDIFAIMMSDDKTPAVVAGIPQKGIFARTFGHFDLFIDGQPVVFSNNKEKELLALLIDRNGGTLTSSQALDYLWEDELPDERLKTRFRKLAMGLKRTLETYHIDSILINHNGVRSVDTSKFTCDYYELLAGNTEYVQSFHNSYMTDYTWSEYTLSTLWDYS